MLLKRICCPSCGAGISMDVAGKTNLFCPFCGSQFSIDDGIRTINKNVNTTVNKNVNIHKTYTNEAAIERERRKNHANEMDYEIAQNEIQNKYKETRWFYLLFVFVFLSTLGVMFYLVHSEKKEKQEAIAAGKIQPGQSAEDMEGKDYKAVVEQLKSAGFTNITTVDLNDSGLFTKKKGTVESVTISGDASFRARDFFFPTDKIVIAYH